ncbi:glycosyltransferase family A protein [Candidatus Pseudothioglobus sp. Uisw_050_01]|uniref:glycosyltransferase family A protein n=1 Tax=Candidatus Pseudothioglobus sp. Uisw_050_01 TaxID=3230997 RepID=UPI003A89B51E
MFKFLQIVILSRDRAEYLQESIESVLAQNDVELDYEIIISDNSEQNDVNELINKFYSTSKKIKYIRRVPPVSAQHHNELVISELNSKFAVIFHDDDILHPDYLKTIGPFILNNPPAAISCNAKIFKNKITDGKKLMHHFKSIKRFNNKQCFLEQYLVGNGGIAPYPGYVYNTSFLQKVSFDSIGKVSQIGWKHFDVSILSSLLDYGDIIWLPETLMFYRLGGDSNNEDVSARLRLLRYMFMIGIDRASKPVFLYRYLFWLNWIRQQEFLWSNLSNWRYQIVIKFIFFKAINVICTSYFWKTCFRKLQFK